MRNVNTLNDLGLTLGLDLSNMVADGVPSRYLSGAGKTTVVDGDFSATPPNGAVSVHYDTSGAKAYISVRANGVWKVMAGPL